RPPPAAIPAILVGCYWGSRSDHFAAAGLVQAPAVTRLDRITPAARAGGTQARRRPDPTGARSRSARTTAAVCRRSGCPVAAGGAGSPGKRVNDRRNGP